MKLPAWLEAVSPGHLAHELSTRASPRKGGLFARHLCRCFPTLFADPVCAAALDAGDRFAEGELDPEAFNAAVQAADTRFQAAQQAVSLGNGGWTADASAAAIARDVATHGFHRTLLSRLRRVVLWKAGTGGGPRKNPTARAVRPVFFEHFGDIRSPVTLELSWRTSTVLQLCETMYATRDFTAMPILADALMDAGCNDAVVLDHCQGNSTHVRGCWVVDQLLGKS